MIGGVSSSIDFIIYTILVTAHLNVLVANVIGVNIGILTSFVLNRQYNFKVKDRVKQRFISFYTIGLIGLGISSAFLYLFVDLWDMNKVYSKVITIILVAIIQFILNSRVTFKKR